MQGASDIDAFATWMTEVRASVEGRLRGFFDDERRVLTARAPAALPLLEAIEDITMRGGKRFRPALLAAAHHAVASPDEPSEPVRPEQTRASARVVVEGRECASSIERTLSAGAALELLQTYLLIHDDWMDGDAVRRGGPSAHVLLGRVHPDVHGAASAAVLAGDLACAWAWRLLLEERRDSTTDVGVLCAARALASVSDEVTLGQYLDVSATSDVETVHLLKTASYTTRGPLRIGALLGGASDAQLEALDRFASAIGVAFQLRDDVLGVFGDPAQTGKPAGNDLRAGKRTMLVADTNAHGTAADRAALARAFDRRDASEEEVRGATEAIDRAGARARSEARVESLHRDALAALDPAALSGAGRALLVGAADMLVRRAR